MSSDPTLHDLAAAYAINAVEGDERLRFEAHLVDCDRCQTEVAEVEETMAAMAAETVSDPPDSLRGKVLASIAETEQEAPLVAAPEARTEAGAQAPVDLTDRRRRNTAWARPLAAAAAVLIIAAGAFGLLRSRSADDSIGPDEVAAAPDSVAVDLGATADAPGSVSVVWSPELDAVSVVATELDDPGPGRVYELWFVLEDGVAPAGLFTTEDGSFSGVLEVDELAALGWGLTIEPEGGSDQPTGQILYLAELS